MLNIQTVVVLLNLCFELFLISVITLSLLIFMNSWSRCLDTLTLSSMMTSPLSPFFLNSYILSTSSLVCNDLCIVMCFLVFWSIFWSSRVHFKNVSEYRAMGTTHVFIPGLIEWCVMWLNDIIAITNGNGDNASPRNRPLWILTSDDFFPPADNFTRQISSFF